MAELNRRIVLASRPHGEPSPAHFRMEEVRAPTPQEGEVLLRNRILSLDPYMRGRMSAAKSYAKPVEIGETMVGATVSEVVASRHPDFAPGTLVVGFGGWQDFAISDGSGLRRLDPGVAPVGTALGILGMPGMTAYTGLLTIGRPKAGETVVVAAAAGPVGSLVGQIAKLKGARAVGIAGGAEKCAYLVDELGFDAAVDHRGPDLPGSLAAACPDGIDVYFENVGGAVFEAVLPLLNDFARMPVCGLVSGYSLTDLPPGPDRSPILMRAVLTKRLHIQGFIVWDFADQEAAFLAEVGEWLAQGRVKHREDIAEGLDRAPEAFVGLLKGRNFGKMLVRLP
ncbi:NADP-dependent oxidoreductase [Methylobacterium sp. Leaf399]|uniref:NADP-dependent oxidoreductase n=1 Tax=unclassified Methylobacterium TaxID=2615210 RepID=UPI0006F43F17|nr:MULTISPECIES: NADP-dependent oxidoreductase [unclassified Methylobacterium]KQP55061.1 NADP-dependent oxidoreductase [Methylobacterium sp. Leaf108]KQT09798.1 NADP-dependent oxidoreductase [Methylobacterium sp. Leaf399]